MSLENTTTDYITQVRDIADEDNTTDVNDTLVLRMLNRAQQELVRILTRNYKSHFMREELYAYSDLKTDAGGITRVLPIADQAFGFAVNSVDVRIGTSWFPVNQVPFSHTLGLDNAVDSSFPLSYSMQGNDIYLYPAPSNATSVRVRYQFRAPKLVKPQGRITGYDSNNVTVTLDSLGSDLSTNVSDLTAFVNIIDHLTGEIKATMQVSGITTASRTLQLKTSALDRSEVFGYTTSTALPTTITEDDYICSASGTCVPYLSQDMSNFLVDIAGFYTKRKLGTIEQADYLEREAMFKAIASMQFGRQYTKKINRTRTTSNFSLQPFFRGN